MKIGKEKHEPGFYIYENQYGSTAHVFCQNLQELYNLGKKKVLLNKF